MLKKLLSVTVLVAATLGSAKVISGGHGIQPLENPWNGMSLDQKVNAMPKGDATRGQTVHNSMMCNSCHGAMGQSASRNYPTLSGQSEQYILRMMLDYQQGGRWQDNQSTKAMVKLARAMDDQQLSDLSAYLAAQESMPWSFSKPDDSEQITPAIQNLVMTGDSSRMITGCAGCHGMQGQGVSTIPALAGQVPDYFVRATKAFRTDYGRQDVHPMMRMIADNLTDEEIDALANYYALLGKK